MESCDTIFSNIFENMIIFKKADKKTYVEHQDELKNLYLKTFTKGLSAQHISDYEATKYLDDIFLNGYGIFCFFKHKLIGVLLSTPLSFDKECPIELTEKYDNTASEYIAEVLVDETYRGKGLGKKLMHAFDDNIREKTENVFLRVWDKNEAAVGLYQKMGFRACGNITQTKLKPTSKEPFEMNKIYMIKSY